MRILVDENTAVQLMEPLRHLLPKHQVDHVAEIRWKGKKDKGLAGPAPAIGAVIAAMSAVIAELEASDGQRLVRIVSIDPASRRFEVTDPAKDPPPYWPRKRPGRSYRG